MSPPVYYFKSPSGDIITANGDDAVAYASDADYSPAEPAEVAKYQRTSGLLNTATAAAQGALSTATFGASDWAQNALIGDQKERAENEAAHPVATGIGDVAGAILPTLIPGVGEASAPGLIARAGRAVEGVAGKVAAGAAEGTLYAAGNISHEAALGDPGVPGEALAELGKGALLGGALGAATKVGGDILTKVTGKLTSANALDKLKEITKEAQAKAGLNVINSTTGTNNKLIKSLTQMSPEEFSLACQEDGLITKGDTATSANSRAQQARQEQGDKLGGYIRDADNSLAPKPDPLDVLDEIEATVIRPKLLGPDLDDRAAAEKIAKQVSEYQKAYQNQTVPNTWNSLHDIESSFGAKAYAHGNPYRNDADEPLSQLYARARKILSDEVDKGVTNPATNVTPEAFKEANQKYGRAALLEQITQPRLGAELGNNMFGLTTQMAGFGGLTAAVSGHPLGLAIPVGVAMAKRYGPGLAMDSLAGFRKLLEAGQASPNAVQTLTGIQALQKSVAERIAEGVGSFLRAAPGAIKAGTLAAAPAILARIDHVKGLANNPSKLIDQIQAQTTSLSGHAPQTAQAASMAMAMGVHYLATQAPVSVPQGMLADPSTPGNAALTRYDQIHQAVLDPIAGMQSGQQHQIDAVKATAPATYKAFVTELLSQIADGQKPASYARARACEQLLGVNLTGTLKLLPGNQQIMMGSVQPQMPQKPKRGRTTQEGGKALAAIGTSSTTAMQRLQERKGGV